MRSNYPRTFMKKELFFFTGIGLSSLLFSIIYFSSRHYLLGYICLIMTGIYLIAVVFYKLIPNILLHNFTLFNIILYSVMLTFEFGWNCASLFFTVNILPAAYLFQYSRKRKKNYYIVVGICSTVTSFFIVLWPLINPFKNIQYIDDPIILLISLYNVIFVIVTLWYLSFEAVREINKMKEKKDFRFRMLDYEANHDKLTELPNRRFVMGILKQYDEKEINDKEEFCAAIFDIDKFKNFNDKYGHDCGDYILHEMAAYIKTLLIPGTEFGRWGGEEFILVGGEKPKIFFVMLEEIRKSVEKKHFVYNKEKDLHLTLTFGAEYSGNCTSLDDLLIKADDHLYSGKMKGRNQVVFQEVNNA